MKDPKSILGGNATDFERRWLAAARAEEPPPEVVLRLERALGFGTGVPALPAPSAKAATAAAKGGLTALRIAGFSVLGVGGAIGLVLLLSRSAPPHAPVADRPPPLEIAAAANPPVVAPSSPPPAPSAERDSATPPAAVALRDEIALIDGARAALAAGSPAEALTLLDRYRARHPHGMLLPEALAMRIEAIDRSGDHARARALAHSFLAQHPHSPLAPRLVRLAAPPRR